MTDDGYSSKPPTGNIRVHELFKGQKVYTERDQECFIQEEELYIPTPAAGEWEGVGALVEGAGSYLFTNTKGSNAIHLLYLQEGDDFLFDDNGNRFSFARLREYYTHFARINLPGTQKE